MDRMASMTTFVKVVQSGGFAPASRKLNMAPSTVTTHIQALEEWLGARLLNRSTRNVSLTEVGKAYYERCLQILAELDDADKVVQSLHSTPRGHLMLNTSVGVPRLLAPVIAEFIALYPEMTVSLTVSARMVDLVEEGLDLAIRLLSIPDSSVIVRRVGSFRLLVCGAPSYFAEHGIPREPRDLVNHNCMHCSQSELGGKWPFDGLDEQDAIRVTGNVDSNSIEMLKYAAVHGQGLAMLPSFMVAEEIRLGRLVPVLTEFLRAERPINAFYPHRHHLSAKVRAFLDLTTKHSRLAHEEFGSGEPGSIAVNDFPLDMRAGLISPRSSLR